MRNLKYSILALAFIIGAASCGSDNPENNASSTPIDSTNLYGTAPATYGADDPASPESQKYQRNTERGNHANTNSSEDTAKGRY